jgi:outer membrane scaffolding protein for murein synthesis (MipA/OmpV family)
VLLAFAPCAALAQTPSPLQEWQYSSGIILERLYEPEIPEWRRVLGAGAEIKPLYDGAERYRVLAGPVIDIRYRDIAFVSVGEGVGVNILRGENYLAGVEVGYDLGRRVSQDYTHLHGLGDISRAADFKVFGSYVVSKQLPLVLRADAGRFVGGTHGWRGDFGAYLPLPGSSAKFIIFAGPSISVADHRYLQREFGVTSAQASSSGYPPYEVRAGCNAAGFGFTSIYYISNRWLLTTDAALSWLLGSAHDSPVTQRTVQRVFALSLQYKW